VLQPTYLIQVSLTDQERLDDSKNRLKEGPSGKIDLRLIRIGFNKTIDSIVYTFTFKDKIHVIPLHTSGRAGTGKYHHIMLQQRHSQ